MRKLMTSTAALIVSIFISSLTYAAAPVYSGDAIIAIEPGTNREIVVDTLGAKLASRVWVTGKGVTAAKLKRQNANPNRLSIRLTASPKAAGGSRTLKLQLPAGVHERKIEVHGLPTANIEVPERTLAGRIARINLGRVSSRHVVASSPQRGGRAYEIKGPHGQRYIEVSVDTNARANVPISLHESHTAGRKGHRNNPVSRKNITVRFVPDPEVPSMLTVPKDPRADNLNSSGRVTLSWRPVNGATGYSYHLVRWGGVGTTPREFTRNNLTEVRSYSTGGGRISTTRSGLQRGQKYHWCVKAHHKPERPSTLKPITGPCTQRGQFQVPW